MIRMEKSNEFKAKIRAIEELRESNEVKLAEYADSVLDALNEEITALRFKYRVGAQLREEGITMATLSDALTRLMVKEDEEF